MRTALRMLENPLDQQVYIDYGLELHNQGRSDKAAKCYEKATQTFPNHAGRFVLPLALDLLHCGDWDNAWKIMGTPGLLSRRLGKNLYEEITNVCCKKPWSGGETKGPLLIVGEQGLGDNIQSMRFILDIKLKNIDSIYLTRKELVPLIQEGSEITNVCSGVKNLPKETQWVPIMNLIPMFWKQEEKAKHATEYLDIREERVKKWEYLLRKEPKKALIALHWQGNPEHEKNSFYAKGRSMMFKEFTKLGGKENVEFVSIQKGSGSEQFKADTNLQFVKGQDKVSKSMDLRDTGAVLRNCELLITCDSAVAHLAGAMGVTCWLLLSYIPDWRWEKKGCRTQWYESIRVFRQKREGAWSEVMKSVNSELIKWLKENHTV